MDELGGAINNKSNNNCTSELSEANKIYYFF